MSKQTTKSASKSEKAEKPSKGKAEKPVTAKKPAPVVKNASPEAPSFTLPKVVKVAAPEGDVKQEASVELAGIGSVTVKRYTNKTIQVLLNGVDAPAGPVLRAISEQCGYGIERTNENGVPRNTREYGRLVLNAMTGKSE